MTAISSALKAELSVLKQNYTSTLKVHSATFPISLSITFIPADVNFPVDWCGLRLRFTIPESYPITSCGVRVTGIDLPKALMTRLDEILDVQCRRFQGNQQLVKLEKWLDSGWIVGILCATQWSESYLCDRPDGSSQRRYYLLPEPADATPSDVTPSAADDSRETDKNATTAIATQNQLPGEAPVRQAATPNFTPPTRVGGQEFRDYLATLTPLEAELVQVERRFRNSYISEVNADDSVTCFLLLEPSDPDFPKLLLEGGVRLSLRMPATFPLAVLQSVADDGREVSAPLEVRVLNSEYDIPAEIKNAMEGCILRYVMSHNPPAPTLIRQIIKWIDNNLHELLRDLVLAWEQESDSESNSSDDGQDHDHSDQDDVDGARGGDDFKFQDANAGTQSLCVMFNALMLQSISLAQIVVARLMVTCVHCSNTEEWGFSDADANAEGEYCVDKQCSKCAKDIVIAVKPLLMHVNTSLAIQITKLVGGLPKDVLPCDIRASCEQCSTAVLLTRVAHASPALHACFVCHSRMSLVYERCSFVRPQGEQREDDDNEEGLAAGGGRHRKSKAGRPTNLGLVVGTPLPQLGRCRHYRKSHRWLRFPCCGKAFPCDICHEESEDHEMLWANRMICGFCSREMPFSQKKVCECGNAVTKSRSSHWEGGQGCRDQRRMAGGDRRKYAGKHKTRCAKDSRVGLAGKQKTEQAKRT